MSQTANHDTGHSAAKFAGFQHPITPVGGDDGYPIIDLANAEMKIGHQRVNHVI